MCTVSVIRPAHDRERGGHPGVPLVRLICNRDEVRTRARSTGPQRLDLGPRRAVMPIDPESGGSWVGANDAGLVACLLNANPTAGAGGPENAPRRRSRGILVPLALECSTIGAAVARIGETEPSGFLPFRLMIFDAWRICICEGDGSRLTLGRINPMGPARMLTSSGLGDRLVEPVRRPLFEAMLRERADPLDAQEEFHRHRWRDRAHLSVLMSRPDARTVSQTTVDLFHDLASVSFCGLDDELVPEAHAGLGLTLAAQPVHP